MCVRERERERERERRMLMTYGKGLAGMAFERMLERIIFFRLHNL